MRAEGIKILVVEDESVVAMDLRKILVGLGYRVTDAVGTGAEAIESVAGERPDLVLMDIRLRGDLDGIETAGRIRAADVPIVYLTAYSEQPTLDRASATEPFGYLLKPFDERELQVAIELALHRHRAERDREALIREQAARAALAGELHWARCLADAGLRLSAALDEKATLQALVELAAGELGDVAAVHVVTADGLATVAAAGPPRFVEEMVRAHPAAVGAHEGARGPRRVIARNAPELIAEVRDAALHEIALDSAHARVLREIGVRSLVCVPLAVREAPLGALTIGRGPARAPFDERDLARALALGSRAALAVENARLFERVQSANQELSRAVHFSEMFIGILGHDLRNPLSAITTGAALLRRRDPSADASGPLMRIQRSATRMERMIDQILDFTRIRIGGGLPIEPRPTDLGEVFRGIIDELHAEHGVDIPVHLAGDPVGRWDADRLGQLASNLIGNALQHGTGDPAVKIDGSDVDRVAIDVSNRGAIPPAIARDVFEPLAATGASSAKRAGSSGLGLGLYISRQIVAAHGGAISCESDGEDVTRFRILLPRTSVPGGTR